MSGKFRAFVAGVLLSAVVFAVGLSSAPQLHDALHGAGDLASHQCAATLISSGSVEHSDCEPVETVPQLAPIVRDFVPLPGGRFQIAEGFSPLEHAPPVLS